MIKLNRILSAAVAMAMSFTMFAGAVNLDAAADEPETETLTGIARVITADGVKDTEFEYTVPVDATEEERSEIASQAAEAATGMNSVGRSARTKEQLAHGTNISLRPDNWSYFDGGTFVRNGGKVEVALTGISNCDAVQIRVSGIYQTVDVSNHSAAVVFVSGDLIIIRAGNPVDVEFRGTPRGSASWVDVYQIY